MDTSLLSFSKTQSRTSSRTTGRGFESPFHPVFCAGYSGGGGGAEVATAEQVALRWRPELSYSKELKINSCGQDNM
jgi:hypothetical protein